MVDLNHDYGFRPAYAVELKTADGQWMRCAFTSTKDAGFQEPLDRLEQWLEAKLTRKVQNVSNG